MTLNKCRICLENKKTSCTIFDAFEEITYFDMLIAISNVKVSKSDILLDKLCKQCQKNLEQLYEFKNLIERSHRILLNSNSNIKKIHFNNANDMRAEIGYLNVDLNPVIMNDFKSFMEETHNYHNTTIKRINLSNKQEDDFIKDPMPVLEFLNSIKNENDGLEYDMDDYASSDLDEYIPPAYVSKKSRYQKSIRGKKSTVKGMKSKNKKIKSGFCIKPIYLDDVRLVPASKRNGNKRLSKETYTKRVNRKEVCPYCGKISKYLSAHLLLHTGDRKYKCDKCGKSFYQRCTLTHHMKYHANREYKCNICVATFPVQALLKSHLLSHSDIRKFSCDVCNKAFKRSSALARHVLIHNSANKSFKCELCNMSFFTNYGLKHHMRVHTGERPYACELCSQPYSYKHDFNRHCFKKHGVFLKRRSINVMNQEVLERERALMRDLSLRAQGLIREGEPLNPFEGPQAAQAFELAMKTMATADVITTIN